MEKKEKNRLFEIYTLFGAGFVMTFIPVIAVIAIGFVFFLSAFLAAYFYRSRSDEDSLMYSHMVFIIRSVWIGLFILGIGAVLAFLFADQSPIYEMMDNIQKGNTPSEEDIFLVYDEYVRKNMLVFVFTMAPGVGYFVYRISKGLFLLFNDRKA